MARCSLRFFRFAAAVAIISLLGPTAMPTILAQSNNRGLPRPKPGPFSRKQKPASQLIGKQEPPRIFQRPLDRATPDNTSIVISLSKQRAYLFSNGELAVDTPISSGKAAGMTPTGKFRVTEKDLDHRSNQYGNFVNRAGEIVRSGVSSQIDVAPSGTHFVGAPMRYFLRLTDYGVGMHIGILPGYPASHGCIRQPAEIAPIFYGKTKIGTPVEIVR